MTLIGIGEDGLAGLSDASRFALTEAKIVFGGARHLALAGIGDKGRPWDVPFSIDPVLAAQGKKVVVLASGDPFWHGVGGTLAQHLQPGEWRCLPAPSCWSIAAARMGWRLEDITPLALHAASFEKVVPLLARDQRVLCTLRDGQASMALAEWLTQQGFGASDLTVMEALGGPRERLRTTTADCFDLTDVAAPVMAAVTLKGSAGLSQTPGRSEDIFAHDGQITKAPMRALTLAALAPRAGAHLWDIGAGSGSVSVEWALAARGARATAIEPRDDRCENIAENARRFGLSTRIKVITGTAPAALKGLPRPDAVFLGGGADETLLTSLWDRLPKGTRLVANAVTLESQALLTRWHGATGGQLLRIDLAQAGALGRMSGWQAARSQVQWSVTR